MTVSDALYLFTSAYICENNKTQMALLLWPENGQFMHSCNCGQFEGKTDVTKQIGFGC